MATRNSSRSGGNRPRTHPTRSVKSTKTRHPPVTPTQPTQSQPLRIPVPIELAIAEQRGSLGTAISLLYCLHSALRREIEDGGPEDSEAVEFAAEGAELTHITAALLVQLRNIHIALDSVHLTHANVDPERVKMLETFRKLEIGSDEGEAS